MLRSAGAGSPNFSMGRERGRERALGLEPHKQSRGRQSKASTAAGTGRPRSTPIWCLGLVFAAHQWEDDGNAERWREADNEGRRSARGTLGATATGAGYSDTASDEATPNYRRPRPLWASSSPVGTPEGSYIRPLVQSESPIKGPYNVSLLKSLWLFFCVDFSFHFSPLKRFRPKHLERDED